MIEVLLLDDTEADRDDEDRVDRLLLEEDSEDAVIEVDDELLVELLVLTDSELLETLLVELLLDEELTEDELDDTSLSRSRSMRISKST